MSETQASTMWSHMGTTNSKVDVHCFYCCRVVRMSGNILSSVNASVLECGHLSVNV